MYGHTDLGDYYADRLTLRQVMVRLLTLPRTPPNRAPIWDVIDEMDEKATANHKASEIEATLARVRQR